MSTRRPASSAPSNQAPSRDARGERHVGQIGHAAISPGGDGMTEPVAHLVCSCVEGRIGRFPTPSAHTERCRGVSFRRAANPAIAALWRRMSASKRGLGIGNTLLRRR